MGAVSVIQVCNPTQLSVVVWHHLVADSLLLLKKRQGSVTVGASAVILIPISPA